MTAVSSASTTANRPRRTVAVRTTSYIVHDRYFRLDRYRRSPPPAVPALPQPSIIAPSVPTPSRVPSTVSTSMAGSTACDDAIDHDDAIDARWGPFPRHSSAARPEPYRRCLRSAAHRPPYAALRREVRRPMARLCRSRRRKFRAVRRLARFSPTVAQLAATSIDPTMAVMPTPNTSACAESMTMNLATPGTMAPANATGAAATPGVSPPAGC